MLNIVTPNVWKREAESVKIYKLLRDISNWRPIEITLMLNIVTPNVWQTEGESVKIATMPRDISVSRPIKTTRMLNIVTLNVWRKGRTFAKVSRRLLTISRVPCAKLTLRRHNICERPRIETKLMLNIVMPNAWRKGKDFGKIFRVLLTILRVPCAKITARRPPI
jgi:hypothetical protein